MPDEHEQTTIAEPIPPAQQAIRDTLSKFSESKAESEAPAQPAPAAPAAVTPAPPVEPAPAESKSAIPSFLRPTPEPAPADSAEPAATDFPAEPPPEIKDEKAKANWRELRSKYETRGKEIEGLQSKLGEIEKAGHKPDQASIERLSQLEKQNQQLLAVTERLSIEHHPKFVNEISRPLHNTTAQAKQILKDAGGNPEELDVALGLEGKAHYDALAQLYSEIPESAKMELGSLVAAIKGYEKRKSQVLANAGEVAKNLRQQDMAAQQHNLETQQNEMLQTLQGVTQELRDVHKLEVLQRSNNPEDAWWNEQADQIEKVAEDLLVRNTDMRKFAATCLLGASADVYRNMFNKANETVIQLQKDLAAIRKSEPNLSSANGGSATASPAADAKASFTDGVISRLHARK